MAGLMNLSIVSPDQTVVNEEVRSVIAPGSEGYMGIQPGHIPVITALQNGVLEFRSASDQKEYVAIGGGFMEVSENQIIVLADDAHRASEIDLAEAEKDLDRALRALRGEPSDMTSEQATQEVGRSMARIKAARRK